ncbi:V-type proton ATPase subunit C isoform X2 [Drosophila willistoni]|uniref:V-type proton ATPase subunit C isoform X2 n=1 Tax=Drosophila willistoni TaxID=7260 RepID=UPI000C26C197|nr:V-type proton ATPase subunit C isoform X2 [Drosophila willistoni]
MLSEYWIISAPGDKTCQQTFDTMNNLTSKQHNLCNNYKFHIPDLKVGTLDQLVGLSDDLGKLDTYVEQITRKVANYLNEVLEDQRDKLHENLQANNSPGPPDDSMPCRHHQRLKHLSLRHQRKHQHTHHQNNPIHYPSQHHIHRQLPADIKGKSTTNLSISRETTTTSGLQSALGGVGGGDGAHTTNTIDVSSAAAAAASAVGPVGSGSAAAKSWTGGSLNNLSSTMTDDYDFVIPPPGCICDDCYAGSAVFAPPSTSATASTLMADEYFHSQTTSSMLNATRCAISTVAAIATGSSMATTSAQAAASSSAAAAALDSSNTNEANVAAVAASAVTAPSSAKHNSASTLCSSSAYFSTSAPTTSSSVHSSMSRSNSKKLNNNTCSINNNNSTNRNKQEQKQPASPPPPLQSPTQKSCSSSIDDGGDSKSSPQSPQSELSETFDWWFNKPKRSSKKSSAPPPTATMTFWHQFASTFTPINLPPSSTTPPPYFAPLTPPLLQPLKSLSQPSTPPPPRSSYRSFFNSLADQIYSKRSSTSTTTTSQLNNINNGFNLTPTHHRSSPVSSCCGSSSQGRSSPDTDNLEPPEFPLSPANLPQYLTRFQWDMAKYPIKQSLRNIADIISKQIGQIDGDLKTKSQAYNNLKGNLQNLEKKKSGSLLTRNLADLVKKEHFILDSEYLTTLLVIVPKAMANDWLANYEKITDMIVPRSSQLIKEDPDYCLFNVTLFKKVAEEFKLHARERKFIVRDFVYNEEELAAGKNEITKLMTDKKKQFGPLVRWLKVNFSEAFCALIHVKALRVFVESVLRYGLPVNFQAILIEPNKKSVKRLRDVLNQLYGHLDGAAAGGHVSSADNVDIPGLGFGQSEYFPYVFYKVNIEMVEQPKV